MTVNYTEKMNDRIRSESPLNFEKAEMLGAEFGKKTRSVIAKAISLGVEYQAKPRQTKSGEAIERKDSIVKDIESVLGVSVPSLVKATKADLEVIRTRLS